MREGALRPGEKLPTVRALAERLGVAPATVSSAYRALRGRGLVVADGRRGTRISPRPVFPQHPAVPLPEGVRDLANGNPDTKLLPTLKSALRSIDPGPLLYGTDLVFPRLGEIAEREFKKDGIPSGPIAVTSGALDGVERALRERLRPGDRVAVEDPGFTSVFDLVTSAGMTLVPMALDEHGVLPESMERALRGGAEAMILTPRSQNPTGAAITPERAKLLSAILDNYPETLVIEDDHTWQVSGVPPVTTCTPERKRWAVVRSVSKALGPDLRVALVTGDEETIGRMQHRQSMGMRWVSHMLQQIAAALLDDPKVQALLERAAATYKERREALIEALAEHGIEAYGRSGFNVWIPLREEATLTQVFLVRGWALSAGERFRIDSPPAIRVTVASLEPEDARRFAAELGEALDDARGYLSA